MKLEHVIRHPTAGLVVQRLRNPHHYTWYLRLIQQQDLSSSDLARLNLRRRQALVSYVHTQTQPRDSSANLMGKFVREGTEFSWEQVPSLIPTKAPCSEMSDCVYWRSQTWWGQPPASRSSRLELPDFPTQASAAPAVIVDMGQLQSLSPIQADALRKSKELICSTLLDAKSRLDLEKAFCMPVRIFYSYHDEVPCISSCSMNELHVLSDCVHIEVVDEEGSPVEPGHRGELLLTAFDVRNAFVVRAPIGQSGTLSPHQCECGLPFPRIHLE